jgi:LacI family transcriptional regulator
VNQEDQITAYKCIEYLYNLGHRKIGIINGDLERSGGTSRIKCYNQGMKNLDIKLNEKWILSSDFSEDSGYQAMVQFLNSGEDIPTSFAVANDSLAFGAMRAIKEAGLSVPDDISIVAIDNHPLAAYVKPGLTTFSYDLHELADQLVNSAVFVLKNPGVKFTSVAPLQSTLIERESCRRIGSI